ncbi:hypothetical protein C7H19_19335 [Aphanothece hegewaldii CCALA 016]|uniref:Uncharacterized protein n=1 Tax=Aphanothece hegewaldii CCALA 016 TaxID=2107694 RepID=A0A2T1LTC3_9CHRO|nr:hypothetical protein [Aphanothece hegewaldii]PSF33878.1 hypothetical protein C7H19_19335 [Aphanothece hegewaldii CCALA 016]
MNNLKDLPDIRNHLYDEAEKLWWWSIYLNLGAQFSSLIVVLINKAWVLAIAGFLALVAPIVVIWLRESASTFTQQADKCRRLILYADGLGEEISKDDLATIRSWATGIQLKEAPFISPYYASNLPFGTLRLVDIVAESAYFTSHLAGKAVNYLKLICAISVIVLLSILFISISVLNSMSIVIIIARVAILFTTFLLSGDTFLLLKKYTDLKVQANDTFKVCAKLRNESQLSLYQAMQMVEDYHLTLIQSPPIPLKLYLKYREHLNDAYRKSYGY